MTEPHESYIPPEADDWRARRLMEFADDIRDMGQRVVNNGPEATYAEEKLLFAVRCCVRALYHVGQGSDLIEHLGEVMSKEADLWGEIVREYRSEAIR